MYLYWAKKQKLSDPDLGEYIPDVSTDGKAVLKLAIRCTLGRLAPCQLMDVVEDFLC